MRRRFFGCLALFLALALLLVGCGRRSALRSDEARFWFFDVGQADCTLIRTKDATILIDTGNPPEDGEWELFRMLRRAGVEQVDVLVLTHPHADHIGGAVSVLESFPVSVCLMPALTEDTELFRNTLNALDEEGCRLIRAVRGAGLTVGELLLEVLSPAASYGGNANSDSVAVRVTFDKTVALFMGDATAATESAMLTVYGSALAANILKVSHHGSGGSSGAAFLSAVSPSFAVISCGTKNAYGFPDPDVLRRLDALGATVCRTDTDGTVVLSVLTDGSITKKQFK